LVLIDSLLLNLCKVIFAFLCNAFYLETFSPVQPRHRKPYKLGCQASLAQQQVENFFLSAYVLSAESKTKG